MLERIGTIPPGSPRARDVGRRIGRLLRQRSWSEAELADAMGVPEETVRGIVHGEHLTGREIAGCAAALGARLEEIVGEGDGAAGEADGAGGAAAPWKATDDEAAEIRRRLRSEGEAGSGAPPVSDEELDALLRWMVDEAVAAQDRIERERAARVAAADLPPDPVADDGGEDGR